MIKVKTDSHSFWENNNKSIKVLYGAGINADIITKLAKKAKFKIDYIIDRDSSKSGHKLNGIVITSLDNFTSYCNDKEVEIFITVSDIIGAIYEIEKHINEAVVTIPTLDRNMPNLNLAVAPLRKILLKNKNITFISNTCLALRMYQLLDLPFYSPTIATIIEPNDFYKFCSNLKEYLSEDLVYLDKEEWFISGRHHVVCKLKDIKIRFTVRDDFEIAKTEWNRRLQRINFDNLYFLWDIGHYTAPKDLLEKFNNIDIAQKLIFFTDSMFPVDNAIFNVNAFDPSYLIEKRFLLCDWLNHDVVYK